LLRRPTVVAVTRLRIGDERSLLHAFLDQQRDAVLWKLEGLTDDQVRARALPRSRLHLLGLVKHLAATEQYWLCGIFGRPADPISPAASDDVELDEGDTTESVIAYFERAREASGRAIAEVDLDATATTWLGDSVSFRWALLHVIEESARHAGHADLLRQHIDDTGGHLPETLLPY
jgi:hypothetical protein